MKTMDHHAPTPPLVLSSEANGTPHHDLYHCLADEFHQALGVMLDEVLQRHSLNPEQRREIVSFFLFRFMNQLDEAGPLTLAQHCFTNYPNLVATEPEAGKSWQPTLAFLRRDFDADGNPGPTQQALVCTETWLHEVCGDWEKDYFAS